MRRLLFMLCVLTAAGRIAQAAAIPASRLEVYERAGRSFASVVLWKPVAAGVTNAAVAMAPLLVQEAESATNLTLQAKAAGQADRVSALVISNKTVALDPARPAVYYETDTVELEGRMHARYTYMWCYNLSKKAGRLPMQGVRVTLDSRGYPCLWEILADRSQHEIIFVSRGLEEAARAEYGEALPGRKFAIEKSPAEAKSTVVARVIEDGPVPMGPILYLEKNSRSVSTLICRCMPSQAQRVEDTREYELLPETIAAGESLLSRARQRSGLHAAFWSDSGKGEARLSRVLRLPKDF